MRADRYKHSTWRTALKIFIVLFLLILLSIIGTRFAMRYINEKMETEYRYGDISFHIPTGYVKAQEGMNEVTFTDPSDMASITVRDEEKEEIIKLRKRDLFKTRHNKKSYRYFSKKTKYVGVTDSFMKSGFKYYRITVKTLYPEKISTLNIWDSFAETITIDK